MAEELRVQISGQIHSFLMHFHMETGLWSHSGLTLGSLVFPAAFPVSNSSELETRLNELNTNTEGEKVSGHRSLWVRL